MCHTFGCWWVIDTYLDWQQLCALPCREHQHFKFCLVARSENLKATNVVQGIEAVASLCVGQLLPRLHHKPEIGELVGEYVFVWYILAPQCAATYNQRVRM